MNNILSCITLLLTAALASHAAELPNILWVTSEDNGPHLGCYGDDYATTPNLDALAKKGMIYTRALSNAPVCAPRPHNDHLRHVSTLNRFRAHAQHDQLAIRLQDVSRVPA